MHRRCASINSFPHLIMVPNQYHSESQDIKDRAYALCGRKVSSLPSSASFFVTCIDHEAYSLTSRLLLSSLPNMLENMARCYRHRLVGRKQRSLRSMCTSQHKLLATESSRTSHVHDQQQLDLSQPRLVARRDLGTDLRIPSLMGPTKRLSGRSMKR